MSSHGSGWVGARFRENPFLRRLVLAYALLWGIAAYAPMDRETWLLENLLVFACVALLAVTHRRFAFSNASWGMLFVFFVLHVVGSHYTYSEVPIGGWVRDSFGLARNHYDRVVHFAFGLLLAYPLREISLRIVHVHGLASYAAPPMAILALSAGYEIIESWAAHLADPRVGLAYVGAQGDVWDGQKDMGLALLGALLAMGAVAAYRRVTGREPYLPTR